jgi:hypothetical protein
LTAGQLYYWRVDAVTADSTIKGPLWKFVATTVTGTEQSEAVRPHEYSLYQNYPNPFNPSTTVTYELAKSGNVTLSIFDALGRNVGTLVNAWQEAGRHQVTLNAERLSAGCYYAVLRANAFSKSVKLLLLK